MAERTAALDGNAAGRKAARRKARARLRIPTSAPKSLADYRDGTIARRKRPGARRAISTGAREKARRARLGVCKQSGGYASLRGDSRSAALFKFAAVGDERKKIDEGPLEQMRRLFTIFSARAATQT